MINCFIKKRGERATGFWNYKFARRLQVWNWQLCYGDGKHQVYMRALIVLQRAACTHISFDFSSLWMRARLYQFHCWASQRKSRSHCLLTFIAIQALNFNLLDKGFKWSVLWWLCLAVLKIANKSDVFGMCVCWSERWYIQQRWYVHEISV